MRTIPLGMTGTLVIVSRSELKHLREQAYRGTSIILLQGGDGAPGYAVMVEDDAEHVKRPKPGGPPRVLTGTTGKKRQNNAAKNQSTTRTASEKR